MLLFLHISCSLRPRLPCNPNPMGGASGDGLIKKGERPNRFSGPPRRSCHLVRLQLVEEPGTSPLGAVYAAGRGDQQ